MPKTTLSAATAVLMLGLAALLTPAGPASAQLRWAEPEGPGGGGRTALATSRGAMVAAANPHAVEAALEMLAAGGSATDAAIAAQLVLGLVEPQSSGLGGGAFLVHHDAAAGAITTYDGRETAPAAARPDRFLENGKPIPFSQAVASGLSVGTPGVVRLMEHVHKKHGRLAWAELFQPAIRLADAGFRVSARLSAMLERQGPDHFAPAARSYFFGRFGQPWPEGHLLQNPEYAATLRAIAAQGASAFYGGATAGAILAVVAAAAPRPGDLAPADLSGYRVVEREALCSSYRRHRICGVGPPSSGALAVGQTLALIEPEDLGAGGDVALKPRAMHLIAEAEKLAFADRNRYVGDPAFAPLPAGLLDAAYIASRRRLIDAAKAAAAMPEAGRPAGLAERAFGVDATLEGVGTSHISIVDAAGNAVSMTTSIESAFGSGLWAAGFLLNNQLTDFSFQPLDRAGRPLANAVAPGKRPRSSMAPTIVYGPDGKLLAALGSPGGSRIILYVVKALVALIDWRLDAQSAADLINFGSRGAAFEIEHDHAAGLLDRSALWPIRTPVWHALRLRSFGHVIVPGPMTSGLHIVVVRNGLREGGADQRREGIARGLGAAR